MENKTGLNRPSNSLWRSFKNGDFEEQDVWDVFKERTIPMASDNYYKVNDNSLYESPSSVSAARTIPRPSHGSVGGGNNSKSTTYETHNAQQSAPLPIPQWFINKGRNPRKGSNNDDNDNDEDNDDDDNDDDDEYGRKVPPHEMIAKRLAKTQISSFSVCEGAGRTLKGRDLSKVRNAVLTKTGFLESL